MLLGLLGIELWDVPIAGFSIHLDGHLAMIDEDRAVIEPSGLPYYFAGDLHDLGIETIDVVPGEEWGVNLLCLSPGRVLMSEGSPRTAERLERAGVEVLTIPYDELQKNGGGIHCSTTELVRDPG